MIGKLNAFITKFILFKLYALVKGKGVFSYMNGKIVIVEPPKFIIDELIELGKKYNDEIFFIIGDNYSRNDVNILNYDIKTQYDTVKRQIEKQVKHPDSIFTNNEMCLNITARLAKEYDIELISMDAVKIFRDKARMKIVWDKLGIKTPKSFFFRSSKELTENKDNISFPAIIKPSLGYASCGVKKVNNFDELSEQLNNIFFINSAVISRESRENLGFLVEEYINGDEYSIDTLWFNEIPICSGICSKNRNNGPYFTDRVYYIDPEINENIKNKIIESSFHAVRSIGLKTGASHTEVRFKNDEPYILESTCRPGGGGILYKLFEKEKGFNFTELYYLTQTCKSSSEFHKLTENFVKEKTNDKIFFWYNIPYTNTGIIEAIEGLDVLEEKEEVFKYICFKKPGDIMYSEDMNYSYFLWVLGEYENSIDKCGIFNFVKQYDNIVKLTCK